MKLKLDNEYAYGNFTEKQIDLIHEQMKRPKNKRLYLFGIEFSSVNDVGVEA